MCSCKKAKNEDESFASQSYASAGCQACPRRGRGSRQLQGGCRLPWRPMLLNLRLLWNGAGLLQTRQVFQLESTTAWDSSTSRLKPCVLENEWVWYPSTAPLDNIDCQSFFSLRYGRKAGFGNKWKKTKQRPLYHLNAFFAGCVVRNFEIIGGDLPIRQQGGGFNEQYEDDCAKACEDNPQCQ